MSIIGDFLRDLVGGERHGGCCTLSPAGDWSCQGTSEPDCPVSPFKMFYPGLQCSEVECGTEACCHGEQCTHTTWRAPGSPSNPFDPTCSEQQGDPQGRGTQCASNPCEVEIPEDEFPRGCITKPRMKARAKTGYRWNTDGCQNGQFRMTMRPADQWPTDPEVLEYTHLGYGTLTSVGPIRANEQAAGVEPCARHWAHVVIGNDGYARMMMCGQHVLGQPETRQVSEGRFYLESEESRPKGTTIVPVPSGYAAVAVGYRAPYWVEAHYASHSVYCGILR